MPEQGCLSRKNLIVGFFMSAVLTGMTLWFNIAGLMSLVAETAMGWVVGVIVWVLNGLVFTWVQTVLTGGSMRDDDEDDDHHGGRRMREMEADHAVVRIPVEKPRGPF